MKLSSVIALGAAAAAAPTARETIDPALQNLNYTILALRSASPVHFLSMTAHAGRFYLSNSNYTSSYCPPEAADNQGCPPGNQTVFKGSCALSAKDPQYWDVPEQTLWNTDDGVIGYDFSQVRPTNAYNCPWYIGKSSNDAFNGTIEATYGADGFLACPTAESGVWQVLRSVTDKSKLAPPLGDSSKCLGVSLVAINYNATEYGAWVYS